MSNEPREGSGSNTVLIVSIVGGIVLVVALGCGGLIYVVVVGKRTMSQAVSSAMQMAMDVQNAMAAAQSFVDDLTQGQLDAAYAQTTRAYQERVSREQFGELIAKHPAFKKGTHDLAPPNNFNTATVRFTSTVTGPDGATATCTLQLKKEDEQWKVDRFSVGDEGEAQA